MSSFGSITFVLLSLTFSMCMIFALSLFWVWVMLDLSTIFLIPYLVCQGTSSGRWYKGVAMYFVVQFMGSALILYSIMVFWITSLESYGEWALLIGFILKLGLFPMHFWVPRVFANLHYGGIFIVGAAQKVFMICAVPIMFESSACSMTAYASALASAVYGPIAMFNSNDVKTFLAYSSVNNTGLMVICNLVSTTLLGIYAFVYVVSMMFLVLIFSSYNGESISGIGTSLPGFYSAGFSSIAMSFSGFPPFTDFCLKFLVLMSCAEKGMWTMVFAVLMSGFINLLVWIWLFIVNARTLGSLNTNFKRSLYSSALNTSCVLWNVCGGMVLMAVY
uniref:NADH-ubiquinone oxidoreductase chain 2 n=1 Tax=Ostrea denselamellosa TaxID=74434 RepID=F1ASY6_9BIVA|nr:NADH dehydrogenase subunit 2 [Ostrea denselamellosa]ADE18737.1 NADH dehydrogenase subunit 2 [Ostrea denselamellosa]